MQLTVVREGLATGEEAEVARFLPYSPESITNAMEILAWGLFLGLAVLFVAPVFGEGRLAGWIRWRLVVTGGKRRARSGASWLAARPLLTDL